MSAVNVRRVVAVAAVVLGLAVSSASAGGSLALDGKRKTKVRYDGQLTEPAANFGTDRANNLGSDPTMPALSDCSANSCDITELRLSLPKGSSTGWLQALLTLPRSMNVTVVLYDAKGRAVQYADATNPCCGGSVACCASMPSAEYQIPLSVSRIPAGRYRLVVFDRGGAGTFRAEVEFHAHPQDRRRS
jgi:hypothetical protein